MNLTKLVFDKISEPANWSLPNKLGLCLIFCLSVFLSLYYCFILPIEHKLQLNAQQIMHWRQELNAKTQLLSSKNAQTITPTTTTPLSLLQPQHFSQVLAQLVLLAKENNLEFDSIKPLPQTPKFQLVIHPLLLNTSGSYPQLLHFFTQLSQLHIINTLGDFHLQIVPSSNRQHALQLMMTLNFYSLS